MTTQIKKGTEIWMFTHQNEVAVNVRRLLVTSFGKKQGTAVRIEDSVKIEERIYPHDVRATLRAPNGVMCHRVIMPVADVEDICELALAMAREIKQFNQEHYMDCAHMAALAIDCDINRRYAIHICTKARVQFDTPAYVVGL